MLHRYTPVHHVGRVTEEGKNDDVSVCVVYAKMKIYVSHLCISHRVRLLFMYFFSKRHMREKECFSQFLHIETLMPANYQCKKDKK